ncbi:MAG: hybrid sensor histidine kinase/response regulator [Desulfobacterales bacterium]|nr:hybrid sensor histidine kinase/response regulator [Desulfobacterales bacterium]
MEHEYKETILCVDDNPMNLKFLLDFFNENEYKVSISEDGEGALKLSEFLKPDLILLDIMMPGIGGFETCRLLKLNPVTKEIPVIFVTALFDTEQKIKGLELGGVDYITKPFNTKEVLARIKTHLTIRKQKMELHELNATKDRFFSIVSHDLRNAFNPLLISSDILLKIIPSGNIEKILKFTNSLKNSLNTTYKLLENLLEWSRLQRGSIQYVPDNWDIKDLVMEVCVLFTERASQKEIILSNLIEEKFFVYADRSMVYTVFRNLVSNALKFTDKLGVISIYLEEFRNKNFVRIDIGDTGTGISKENLQKLFRLDEKVRGRGTDNEQGTGLGLILCKELVERNKGEIWANSEVGKGSVFSFTLPVM